MTVATRAHVRRLPKVELHCHVEGSARVATIAELAQRNGIPLPAGDPADLFRFTDLTQFLSVYDIVCRSLVTTDDFLTIAEQDSGMKLDWFFELYLRQPKLPKLVSEVSGNTLSLHWETPNNMPFPMPVDVVVDGKTQRVEMPDGKATVNFSGTTPVVDPKGWVLKAQ